MEGSKNDKIKGDIFEIGIFTAAVPFSRFTCNQPSCPMSPRLNSAEFRFPCLFGSGSGDEFTCSCQQSRLLLG